MTTQDKTPIRALIDAVEDGRISTDLIMAAFGNGWDDIMVLAAFDGDLNAALALHEALLPGWVFCVTEDSASVMLDWSNPGYGNNPLFKQEDTSPPARAWLLSILRAYEAQQ